MCYAGCSRCVIFRIQRLRLKMKESQKHMDELDKHLYVCQSCEVNVY